MLARRVAQCLSSCLACLCGTPKGTLKHYGNVATYKEDKSFNCTWIYKLRAMIFCLIVLNIIIDYYSLMHGQMNTVKTEVKTFVGSPFLL